MLLGYGTGAIMGVPAHDERDLEFAQKIRSADCRGRSASWATSRQFGFVGEGIAINSPMINGLTTAEAKKKITTWLEERGQGKGAINYKLRDWLFSRQRYWGEPFPIVWEDGKHRLVGESELPLVPPALEDYKPTGTGEPPLAKAKEWIRYSDKATRETNTMPQWAGSCWYYLRFCDPANDQRFVGEEAERYWMGRMKQAGRRRSLRRRNGARRAASFICALLAQGALRSRPSFETGAVPAPGQSGNDSRRRQQKMSKRWGNVIDPTT